MKKLIGLWIVFALMAAPAYAKPDKSHGLAKGQETAGDRVADEAADALADVLTGKDDKKVEKTTSTLPPGLDKKDKTPAGWEKGKKEGWEKKNEGQEDSPIKKFFKSLFGTAS